MGAVTGLCAILGTFLPSMSVSFGGVSVTSNCFDTKGWVVVGIAMLLTGVATLGAGGMLLQGNKTKAKLGGLAGLGSAASSLVMLIVWAAKFEAFSAFGFALVLDMFAIIGGGAFFVLSNKLEE